MYGTNNIFQIITPNDKMGTHITGVLSHAHPPPDGNFFKYLDINEYPHDSNLTINCLLRTLYSITLEVCKIFK